MFFYNSTMTFSSSNITFSNNSSYKSGGAIYCQNSIISFSSSNVTFSNNASTALNSNGGAVYCNKVSEITFEDSDVEFIGNKAQNGGAIYIDEGIVKLTNARFRNNIAIKNKEGEWGNGGAIYIKNGGTLTITTEKNKISEFVGNKAVGRSNGIHAVGTGTIITFNGNGRVNMEDAIITTSGNVNIGDTCEFHLSGSEVSEIENLKIGDSSTFNLETNAQLKILRDLTIESSGVFNTKYGASGDIPVENAYRQEGTLKVDISEEKDPTGGFCLTTCFDVRREVILGTGSILHIDMTEMGADNEIKTYKLIKHAYNVSAGKFGKVVFSGAGVNPKYDLTYNYDDKWVLFTIKDWGGTDFSAIKGLNVNQKEIARVLDSLAATEKRGEKLKKIGLIHNMRSEEGQKEALRELSGYFISNVIKREGGEGDRRGIYRRLESKEKEKPNIWAEAEVKAIREKGDENLPEEYKNNVIGVLTAYDKKLEEGIGIGIYGKYRQGLINQGNNKGEVKVIGLGVYGGLERGEIDIKCIIEESLDKYKTTREVMINNKKEKSDGKFGGIRGSIEVEGGYNINLKEKKQSNKNPEEKMDLKLRPYVGIRTVLVKTDGFKETGTNPLGLEVKANSYLRTTLRTGVGLKGEGKVKEKVIRWEAGAGLECCAAGRYNEIKNNILNTEEEFKSRSVEEGLLKGEGNIKAEYEITDKVEAYIDGRLGAGNGYSDIGGNIGIRYAF
jgi:predicted outer membrane repeat protein